MPLLSYEGVDVQLPTNLAGIEFEVTAGTLTIHCYNFTGDVVLRQRDAASSRAQQQQQTGSTCSSNSKKRYSDVSCCSDTADDDEVYSAKSKQLRPSFLNEAEQTVLLAQLNGPPSARSDQLMIKNERNAKTDEVAEVKKADGLDAVETAAIGGVQTTLRKDTTKKKQRKSAKTGAVDSLKSFDLVQSIAQKAARASSPNQLNVHESQPEPSPSKFIEERVTDVSMSKAAAVDGLKWETIGSIGNAPTERWGHTATKISNERVVVYGGTDDDERTLGDLHVFDMKTHRWTTPINCETVPRTWHDASYLSNKKLVLVFGGERTDTVDGELAVLSDIMVLDTECFLWFPPAIRGPPPSARSGHTCTAIGNEIVVFGGRTGRNRRSTLHILDTDDWNWKIVQVGGKAPSARTYHSAIAADDKIVYFGGNGSSKSFNEVHVLQRTVEKTASDPVWTWLQPRVVGTPPRERTGHSATLLDDGCIFIFGGWDPQREDASASTSVFSDSFILDTKSWEWQPAGAINNSIEEGPDAMLRGRVGHCAVRHSDGRIYFFGGQDGTEHRLKDICSVTISQKAGKADKC